MWRWPCVQYGNQWPALSTHPSPQPPTPNCHCALSPSHPPATPLVPCRPQEPLCHALFGDRQRTQGLLLRIGRRIGGDSDEEGEVSIKVRLRAAGLRGGTPCASQGRHMRRHVKGRCSSGFCGGY